MLNPNAQAIADKLEHQGTGEKPVKFAPDLINPLDATFKSESGIIGAHRRPMGDGRGGGGSLRHVLLSICLWQTYGSLLCPCLS